MRLTRIEKLMLLVFGIALTGTVHAQGWIKYVNEDDRFIVNFPREPDVREVPYTTEADATIPSRVYSVDDGDSRYSLTVVDYNAAEQAHVDRCRRLEAELDRISPNLCRGRTHLADIRGAIAYEAWNIRRRYPGEITYDAFGQIDGIPGHQIQVLHPDESRSFIGLYMLDRRLYVLEGTVPGNAPPPGHFQQSLGMLDELGRAVRYQMDAAGNSYRVQTLYEWVGEEDPVTGEPVADGSASDGRIRAPRERMGRWVSEASDLVYELRTYTTEEGKLQDLLTLFSDHAIRLFVKHGMTHVGYWVPQDAPRSENTLIYIVAHDTREAAQASWGAFREDPEWQRVSAEAQADGRIVANIESVFIEATDFSPSP